MVKKIHLTIFLTVDFLNGSVLKIVFHVKKVRNWKRKYATQRARPLGCAASCNFCPISATPKKHAAAAVGGRERSSGIWRVTFFYKYCFLLGALMIRYENTCCKLESIWFGITSLERSLLPDYEFSFFYLASQIKISSNFFCNTSTPLSFSRYTSQN